MDNLLKISYWLRQLLEKVLYRTPLEGIFSINRYYLCLETQKRIMLENNHIHHTLYKKWFLKSIFRL